MCLALYMCTSVHTRRPLLLGLEEHRRACWANRDKLEHALWGLVQCRLHERVSSLLHHTPEQLAQKTCARPEKSERAPGKGCNLSPGEVPSRP